MDVREKLVELLTDNLPRIGDLPKCDNPLQFTMDEIVERIADHLIANGVTVQEWISVKDRLPEEGVRVLVAHDDGIVRIGISKGGFPAVVSKSKLNRPFPFAEVTHWMPLPEPPKGE